MSYLPVRSLLSENVQKHLPAWYVGESSSDLAVSLFEKHVTADTVFSERLLSDALRELYSGLCETFPELGITEHQSWTYFNGTFSSDDVYFVAALASEYGDLIGLGYWNQVKQLVEVTREAAGNQNILPAVNEVVRAFNFQGELRDEGVFLSAYDICIFQRTCNEEDIIKLLAEQVDAETVAKYAKLGFTDYDSIVNTAMKLPEDWISRIFDAKID